MAAPNLAPNPQQQPSLPQFTNSPAQLQQPPSNPRERIQYLVQVRLSHFDCYDALLISFLPPQQRANILRNNGYTPQNNEELQRIYGWINSIQHQLSEYLLQAQSFPILRCLRYLSGSTIFVHVGPCGDFVRLFDFPLPLTLRSLHRRTAT